MENFVEYNPGTGINWNAMTGIGGVWIRDGETAILRCPECGLALNLGKHRILPTGEVDPEVECSGCGWKDFAQLLQWDERHGRWWRPKWFDWKAGNVTEEEMLEEEEKLRKMEAEKK